MTYSARTPRRRRRACRQGDDVHGDSAAWRGDRGKPGWSISAPAPAHWQACRRRGEGSRKTLLLGARGHPRSATSPAFQVREAETRCCDAATSSTSCDARQVAACRDLRDCSAPPAAAREEQYPHAPSARHHHRSIVPKGWRWRLPRWIRSGRSNAGWRSRRSSGPGRSSSRAT